MGRNRVEMIRAGYNELRNSSSVVDALEAVASGIQQRAQANADTLTDRPFESTGEDITVQTVHNPSRAVTFVATATLKGRVAEAKIRALNRAIG